MDIAISVWATLFVLKLAGELEKISWKFILIWPGLLVALFLILTALVMGGVV